MNGSVLGGCCKKCNNHILFQLTTVKDVFDMAGNG